MPCGGRSRVCIVYIHTVFVLVLVCVCAVCVCVLVVGGCSLTHRMSYPSSDYWVKDQHSPASFPASACSGPPGGAYNGAFIPQNAVEKILVL
jgi:hypothetical protein